MYLTEKVTSTTLVQIQRQIKKQIQRETQILKPLINLDVKLHGQDSDHRCNRSRPNYTGEPISSDGDQLS